MTLFAGTNATRSAFNIEQSHCGAQERGSRVTDYKRTPATPASAEKVVSISAMPAYENKSHEELRWEDYKSIGKGMLEFFRLPYASLYWAGRVIDQIGYFYWGRLKLKRSG